MEDWSVPPSASPTIAPSTKLESSLGVLLSTVDDISWMARSAEDASSDIVRLMKGVGIFAIPLGTKDESPDVDVYCDVTPNSADMEESSEGGRSSGGVGRAPDAGLLIPKDWKEGSCRSRRALVRCETQATVRSTVGSTVGDVNGILTLRHGGDG